MLLVRKQQTAKYFSIRILELQFAAEEHKFFQFDCAREVVHLDRTAFAKTSTTSHMYGTHFLGRYVWHGRRNKFHAPLRKSASCAMALSQDVHGCTSMGLRDTTCNRHMRADPAWRRSLTTMLQEPLKH